MEKSNPYRIALNKLITSIDNQVPLSMPDQVLLLHHLDTEKKVIAFNDWIKSKTAGEKLNATEAEIMRASTRINKGLEP